MGTPAADGADRVPLRFGTFAQDLVPLFVDATQRENWGYTADDVLRMMRWYPDGFLVGRAGDDVVAMVTAFPYGHLGWIGNVIVLGEHRGQGRGREVLEAAESYLRAKGCRTISLYAYLRTHDFYTKYGYREVAEIHWYSAAGGRLKQPAAGSASDGQGRRPAIHPVGPDDVEAVLAYDAKMFRGDRSRLLRDLLGHPRTIALVAETRPAGGVAGFLIAKRYGKDVEIGPWMAETESVGRALLALVTPSLAAAGGAIGAAVPAGNRDAVALVREAGFDVMDRVHLLTKGEPTTWGPNGIYATGALEKG